MRIVNYGKKKKKEMIPLTDKETEPYEKQKGLSHMQKEFSTDKNDKNTLKKHHQVTDHCHYTGNFRGAAHSICNLKCRAPEEILIVFHNGSTYDYLFIMKQLTEEFKGQFECLEENSDFIGFKNTKLYYKCKNVKNHLSQ